MSSRIKFGFIRNVGLGLTYNKIAAYRSRGLRTLLYLSTEPESMLTAKKEPMGNGYDHFICSECGHDNPIVFSSEGLQMLADMADKLNCERCGQTFNVEK